MSLVATWTDRPRVSLSVLGRKKPADPAALDRAAPIASQLASRFRPPMPEIITLSSGIPLWVFPRHDLPTVAGSIVIKAGASLQQPAEAGLAQLTTVMLDEGTTSRTAEQLALAVESMGASIDATCGWDGAYISFRCLASDLVAILGLTVDILLNATFPQVGMGTCARSNAGGTADRNATTPNRVLIAVCSRPSTRMTILTGSLWWGTKRA